MAMLIDTLKLARRLEHAGMPREQAEGVASALGQSITLSDPATGPDVRRMGTSLIRWMVGLWSLQMALVIALLVITFTAR